MRKIPDDAWPLYDFGRARKLSMENRFSMNEPQSGTRVVSFDEFVEPGKKDRKSNGSPKQRLALWRERAKRLLDAQDYDAFGPSELVGLYCVLHEHVYKVAPAEVQNSKVLLAAGGAAARLIRDTFEGRAREAVQFVSWVWRREQQREKKRQRDGETAGGRIGWRLQFVSPAFVTDYQVELQRRRAIERKGKA